MKESERPSITDSIYLMLFAYLACLFFSYVMYIIYIFLEDDLFSNIFFEVVTKIFMIFKNIYYVYNYISL